MSAEFDLNEYPELVIGLAGTHITEAAKMLIAFAVENNSKVWMSFNDIKLVANTDSEIGDVVQSFSQQNEEREQAYLKSPAYEADMQQIETKRQEKQNLADTCMRNLPFLNFSDYGTILQWLCCLQESSDCIGVTFDRGLVVNKFLCHGFKPNVNTDSDFNPTNEDNVARYIIGQALDCLQTVGAIHSIINKFTTDWRNKFNR